MVIERVRYRVRQFFRALTAPLVGEEWREIEGFLPPDQQELFLRLSAADRRHALAVFRGLRARGARSADLLAAALLHDVGKAAVPLLLLVRVMFVLLEQFAPRAMEQLSDGEARGWRRPFLLYRQHAEVGARWAAEAGCSPLTVVLILRHEDRVGHTESEEDRLLAMLQEADGDW